MKDGLYQVTHAWLDRTGRKHWFCGGFVVKSGHIVECAPVLRKRISYWQTLAKWLGE